MVIKMLDFLHSKSFIVSDYSITLSKIQNIALD